MKKFLLLATTVAAFTPAAFAQSALIPGEATDFVAEFDFNGGAPLVRGSFTAPTQNNSYFDPQPLTEIARIEVTRSCYSVGEMDEPVAEYENPAPGETLSFVDETLEEFGYQYTYTVTAYSSENKGGYGAYQHIYVGVKPAKPEIVSVTTGENGFAPVTITFTAPSLTAEGEELPTPLTSIKIVNYKGWNSEDLLETISDPVPGKEYTFVHPAENGVSYTYQISASTAFGDGDYASKMIYVGEDVPAAPTEFKAEVADGKVHLSWTAPAEGKNGGYIDPAATLYRVSRLIGYDETPIADGLSECNFTDPCYDLTGPTQFSYTVTAYNEKGEGGYVNLDGKLIVGPSSQLPYVEDFNEGGYFKSPANLWSTDPASFSDWGYSDYDYYLALTGVDAADGNDEGYAYCSHRYASADAHERLISGSIDLSEAKYPVLTFFYAAVPDVTNRLSVEYRQGGGEAVLEDFCIAENAPADADYAWVKKTLPMDAAKGGDVSLVFHAYTGEDATDVDNVFIDAIRLDDYPPVEGIMISVQGTTATIQWTAPANSSAQADSFDVYVDDNEPVRVSETEYVFASQLDTEHTVAVRAHYGDVPSCLSEAVAFDSNGTLGIGTVQADGGRVEYFDVNGRKVVAPVPGMFLIKRTTAADGAQKVEKTVYAK